MTSELEGAAKAAKNDHFRSKYADLSSVVDAIKDGLSSNGLAVLQGLGSMVDGRYLSITTRVVHTAGQWIESELQIPLGKMDPQGFGSASTYGRRYALMGMLGIPAVDDDAEAATERSAPAASKVEKAAAAAAKVDWFFPPKEEPRLTEAEWAMRGDDMIFDAMVENIAEIKDRDEAKAFVKGNNETIQGWPRSIRTKLRARFDAQLAALNINIGGK